MEGLGEVVYILTRTAILITVGVVGVVAVVIHRQLNGRKNKVEYNSNLSNAGI